MVQTAYNEEQQLREVAVDFWINKYLKRNPENTTERLDLFRNILMAKLTSDMALGLDETSLKVEARAVGILYEAANEAQINTDDLPQQAHIDIHPRAGRVTFMRQFGHECRSRILFEHGKIVPAQGLEAIIEAAQESQAQQGASSMSL